MNGLALPYLLTSLGYLGVGIWVIVGRHDLAQRLYGILCLSTAVWQALWLVLLNVTPVPSLQRAIYVLYAVSVFVPTFFYHFILVFTGQPARQRMRVVYGFAAIVSGLILWGPLMIQGFHQYAWGYSVRAGSWHPLFALMVGVLTVHSVIRLVRLKHHPEWSPEFRQRNRMIQWATVLYCGGSLDLLSNYGIPLFPLSFLFTGVALLLIGKVLLRYDVMGWVGTSRDLQEQTLHLEASQEMNRLGMLAAFPLVSQGEVMGYLLLGEKMSEESYSKDDLLLLRIVANQAALAYQRVRYMEMAVYGARTEMLGEIAGGFAHEIKTPLANISLPAEMTLLDLEDLEKGRRPLDQVLPELRVRMKEIMAQTRKASEKIEAVRQFSKPGQVKLEMVYLPALIESCLGLLAHLLQKSGVVVRLEAPSTLSPVRGDAKQLEIVFVNLIKNAIEAMASNPSHDAARELTLTLRESGEALVIVVKDTGPGIRRADFGHLFKAYFTTKGSQGTGIGLFLAQQVIKAHGGSIDVSSEEGRGTIFTLHLPRWQSTTKESRAA